MLSQNLPYSCNFDTQASQDSWTYYEQGVEGTSDWHMSGGGHSAPNGLNHDYNVGAGSNDIMIDWMVSPPLNTSGPFTVDLMVRQFGFSTPTIDNCEVYILVGDPDPTSGDPILIGNISAPVPSGTWVPMSFDFTSLVGEFRLAFSYKTIGAAWSTYNIDDIEVTLQGGNSVAKVSDTANLYSVFPNPFNDAFRLSGMDSNEVLSCTVIDATGNTVSQTTISGSNNLIALTHLSAGLYLLRIENEKGLLQTIPLMKR
jgi:hypothetical protein